MAVSTTLLLVLAFACFHGNHGTTLHKLFSKDFNTTTYKNSVSQLPDVWQIIDTVCSFYCKETTTFKVPRSLKEPEELFNLFYSTEEEHSRNKRNSNMEGIGSHVVNYIQREHYLRKRGYHKGLKRTVFDQVDGTSQTEEFSSYVGNVVFVFPVFQFSIPFNEVTFL